MPRSLVLLLAALPLLAACGGRAGHARPTSTPAPPSSSVTPSTAPSTGRPASIEPTWAACARVVRTIDYRNAPRGVPDPSDAAAKYALPGTALVPAMSKPDHWWAIDTQENIVADITVVRARGGWVVSRVDWCPHASVGDGD